MSINNDKFRFRRTTSDNLQPQAVDRHQISSNTILFTTQEDVTGTVPALASSYAPGKPGPGVATVSSTITSNTGATLGLLGYEIFFWIGTNETRLSYTFPNGVNVDASDLIIIGPHGIPDIRYTADNDDFFGSRSYILKFKTYVINNAGADVDITVRVRTRYLQTYGGFGRSS